MVTAKKMFQMLLPIFDETTIAAVKSHFLEKASSAAFLTLFSKWWVWPNSKARYSTANYLGNAAVIGDNKQSFLRTMGDWIQNWQENKIPNCEKFTQTSQTASEFVRTLKCHASLIEDLLAEGYDAAVWSISTDEWRKVSSRTERSNIIKKDN